jgi:probable rRNA maturation factor
MAVLIDNQQEKHPIAKRGVREKAQIILNALDSPEAELSIVLVDDRRISELNSTYLQREGPTNVIAFPMREGSFGDLNAHLLGDVVISMDTCARESRQSDLSFEARFYQLLIHGILHLFGYDHVHDEEEARRMEEKSTELLALL